MASKTIEILIKARNIAEGVLKQAVSNVQQMNLASKAYQTTLDVVNTASQRLTLSTQKLVAALAGGFVVREATMFAKIGAEALQAEETFKNVTVSLGVDADGFLKKMKEVSAGLKDIRHTHRTEQGI